MASLYQKSLMGWRPGAGRSVAGIGVRRPRERRDPEDGGGLPRGVEADRVGGPAPELALVGDQLVRLDAVLGAEPELVERQGEPRLARLVRIQVDGDPDGVPAVGAPLAVKEHVVLVR